MTDGPQIWVGGKELWFCPGIGFSAYQGLDLTGEWSPSLRAAAKPDVPWDLTPAVLVGRHWISQDAWVEPGPGPSQSPHFWASMLPKVR